MLQSLEDFFQQLRNHDDITRTLVTLSTAIGGLWIVVNVTALSVSLIKAAYLFGYSQLVRLDLRKRYGRWAVISGATDGIGLAFAKQLAQRGHSLVIIGRNEEKLNNVKTTLSEISQSPDEIIIVKIDLAYATIKDFERVRDEIDPENRDIGILINNAGVFPTEVKRYLRHDPEEVRQALSVNIQSALMLTRMLMPSMVEAGSGCVINVSSSLGQYCAPYLGVYCATKAFICSFTESLQLEYARHPIDILNLTTGPVYTNLMTTWTNSFSSSASRIAAPTADVYARSALATVGRARRQTSGYWFHSFMDVFTYLIDKIGLRSTLYANNIALGARNNKLSPGPQRRRKVYQPTVISNSNTSESTH